MFPTALTPLGRLIAGIVALLLAALLFWLAMHFYGVHRYDEGVSAEDAKWQAATTQLKQDAGNAATNADTNAAINAATFIEQHSADQNAVANATAEGKSPLDALFGN